MVRFLEHRGDERPIFRNRVHRFAEAEITPGTPTETVGRANPPACGGLLFETVHQLTQVVTSIAKSGPEHYADISFFARRLCLADLGKVIKSCFQFLL
jgi:hypothetical protein